MKFIKSHLFEFLTLLLYIVLLFFFPNKIIHALKEGIIMILKVLPIFICVMFFSSFLSNFISQKMVQKFIGEDSGFLGIIIGILIGTIFVGPLWIMFPLYNTLLKKGGRITVIVAMMATFAIKTPWLPYAATFMGWDWVIITFFLIFIYAIFQGYLMEFILKRKL